MEKDNTHIVFDGKKILISPSLRLVFDFLMKIDKEVESMINIENKLEGIRSQYLETIGLIQVISKVIIDNKLDFKFNFSENPETIAEKLSHYHITRAEMIVLFANLETLLCLHTAYEIETDNENDIREKVKDSKYSKKFINNYILNKSNNYYKEKQDRFKKINAQQLRKLRNKLTHFFSVEGINIIPEKLGSKARILEKKIGRSISFISPTDFYELIKYAGLLLITNWSDDFSNNPDKFNKKISYVMSIVKRDAPILVAEKDLNI